MALVRERKPLFDAIVEAIAALSDLAHSLRDRKTPHAGSRQSTSKPRGGRRFGTGRHRIHVKASKMRHDITDEPSAGATGTRRPAVARKPVSASVEAV